MKRGHIPIRTCLGCGVKQPQPQLIRFSLRDGRLVVDQQKTISGRGVYCCDDEECHRRLKKNTKRVQHALRLKV